MSLPVLTADQMRSWESASWALKVSVHAVIGVVGERLSSKVKALVPSGTRILLLAGRGHNGDDVRAMVSHLKGIEFEIVNVHDPVTASDRVRNALGKTPHLVVDGLFGIGLRGKLPPPWCEIIEMVNESRLPVISVDIPSGLDADTGTPQGAAISACMTIAIGTPKMGHFQTPALPYIGRLEVMSGIGLTSNHVVAADFGSDPKLFWSESRDFQGGIAPARPVASHKGNFGHLVIIAGSRGYHGAAVLAARAAHRARPGLVSVITSPDTYGAVASQLTETMVDSWHPDLALPPRTTAVLVGPGLAGIEVPDWLRTWVSDSWAKSPVAWIADASALDWLRNVPTPSSALRVWTPHPGEAGRILGVSADLIQSDRVGSARRLASGAWTILKGHQTLVAQPGGVIHINPSGNPGLAKGGTGDALGGFIGGLLAQPAIVARTGDALRYAVWDHGAAADRLEQQPGPWTTDDLIRQLGISPSVFPVDPLNPR